MEKKEKKEQKTLKTIEEIYQHPSEIESALKRPEIFTGETEAETKQAWIWDSKVEWFVERQVTYVPAALKIFDEILVNASDNHIRDPKGTTKIKVNVHQKDNEISVWNNGQTVDVVIHKTTQKYVPEMMWGSLHAGTNFDDDEKRLVGGRFGYGAKLANMFSCKFQVDLFDSKRSKKYKQTWENNMRTVHKPKITDNEDSNSYTKIVWNPDWKTLTHGQVQAIDNDLFKLMEKRVFDLAATCPKSVKIFFNGSRVKFHQNKVGFKAFVQAHFPKDVDASFWSDDSKNWEVAIVPRPEGDGLKHVSFVNRVATPEGGTHVDWVVDQIVNLLKEKTSKKKKPLDRRNITKHLFVFVNVSVVNPRFSNQCKTKLTTRSNELPKVADVSKLFKKTLVSQLLQLAKESANAAELKTLKKSDGKARQRDVLDVPGLTDANWAGTKHSSDCTLILCEGKSAAGFVDAGLSVLGHDQYGSFPLRGKMLNVQKASVSKIEKNREFLALKKILGLKQDAVYEDVSKLRYGHVLIMTDSDHDGAHISGLVMNIFAKFWPSLLKNVDGFLQLFVLPIIRVTRGKEQFSFNTEQEYQAWQKNSKGNWKTKYFKGLGTYTTDDATLFFNNPSKRLINLKWKGEEDDKKFHVVFGEQKTAERKDWILNTDVEEPAIASKTLGFGQFMDQKVIHFSIASNIRAIPSVVDGFKPSQRKVLFGCFKRNLHEEIKVAQLAGYVSEHSGYHHGEASLHGTIVNLAQNYMGACNVNWLQPIGMFGSRHDGGEAASARYIFTNLEPITRTVFVRDDDALLDFLNVEGQSVEPRWYVPVVPTVLVNGAQGMGTGWSTFIPPFNPVQIVSNLKIALKNCAARNFCVTGDSKEAKMDVSDNSKMDVSADGISNELQPWYRGFKGTITKIQSHKYQVCGVVTQKDDHFEITELALQGTKAYAETLKKRMADGKLLRMTEHHGVDTVKFKVWLTEEEAKKANADGLAQYFDVVSTISTNNMMLHDAQGKLKKYASAEEIIREFIDLRLPFYDKRKTFLVKECKRELVKLDNRMRFILAVAVEKTLELRNRPKLEVAKWLRSNKFDLLSSFEFDNSNETTQKMEDEGEDIVKGYKYLLDMPLSTLTVEQIATLRAEFDAQTAHLKKLESTSPQQFWLNDLDKFVEAFELMLMFGGPKKIDSSRGTKRVGEASFSKTSKKRK